MTGSKLFFCLFSAFPYPLLFYRSLSLSLYLSLSPSFFFSFTVLNTLRLSLSIYLSILLLSFMLSASCYYFPCYLNSHSILPTHFHRCYYSQSFSSNAEQVCVIYRELKLLTELSIQETTVNRPKCIGLPKYRKSELRFEKK